MLGGLLSLKTLPIILLVGAGLWGAHTWQINQRDLEISNLKTSLVQAQSEVSALRAAEQINLSTIEDLRSARARQNEQIGELQTQMDSIRNERDNYLSIFRRHDLTRLARARPGLIEPRINSGTAEVFRDIEADSREIIKRDQQNPQNNSSNTD